MEIKETKNEEYHFILEANRKFITSKISEELDELMKEFDNTS